MVLRRLLPKETDFFEMFAQAGENLKDGAALLVELMENLDKSEYLAKQIYEIEQQGDMLTHEIMRKLNKTFLTPIDREDIHALVGRLDDVLDLIWTCADRTVLFKLNDSRPNAVLLSKTLLTTTEVIKKAISALKEKKYSYIQEFNIEINRLENRADKTFRDALAKLFDDEKDPVQIIKWKNIFEHLEDATDACEDVANILESIVLKHA
jgi:predicted phosphate transport protein (TIGR00153 family)